MQLSRRALQGGTEPPHPSLPFPYSSTSAIAVEQGEGEAGLFRG